MKTTGTAKSEGSTMRGAMAIAHILQKEGIEIVTCFPYNQIIDTVAALGTRPIMCRTERMAIHIADGYARLTNGKKIAAVCVQAGPGIENAFGAVAQAYGDNTPMILLPGGYSRNQQDIDPNFQATYNFKHITKWVAEVNQAARIPQMMHYACTQLRNGRRAPVMLEIPDDVMGERIAVTAVNGYQPAQSSRASGDPAAVDKLVEMWQAAESPIIVAGQGIFYADACDELLALAELTNTPVMSTLNGKSVFPETHPLALGAGGASRTKMVRHFLDKADLVIGIGTSFTRSHYITPIPDGKTIVQITHDSRDIGKDYFVAHGVIGDAKLVIGQLLDAFGADGGRDETIADEIAAVKAEFMAEWMARLTNDDTPISPYRVIWEVMQNFDRTRTTVTHEAGSPRDQAVAMYEAIVPHGYIGWGKTTQLGTSMGLAVGAKLARPDWYAVHIMGDGAFGMIGMDFETAVRYQIPICTIVLNNGVLGGYDNYLPISTEKFGTRNLSGNYADLARALGGYSERIEQPAELAPAMRRAQREMDNGRAVLLEVMTREESVFAKY
ncbi:MAG: thiamine pyrophosphate-requiring protein [Ardenticatenaceae bacterium]